MEKSQHFEIRCRYCYLLLLILFSSIQAFPQAQNGIIKGKVSDQSGPLAGASVSVSGTSYGAVADVEGNYMIRVPEGTYTVVASFIGYTKAIAKDVKVTAGAETSTNFSLVTNNQLQEVVVSYGKQRAREVTGSIGVVEAKGMQDMPVNQFAQQLQGKVAGVQVSQQSGKPGQGVSFRIRGAASFYADNQPLFVIDGIPITGSINNINPSEIESFSILKDASATSLYGSRAANGVVLITTKHAKAGESKIEFSGNYGTQKIPTERVPKPMNAEQFARFMQERYEDKVKYENFNPANIPAEYQGDVSRYGEGTNWYKLLTRTAPIQNYDLSIQSAREHSSSTVIAGYQEQQGVIINNGTKLFSLRANQDLTLSNNKLKLGFSIAPSYRIDHNNRLGTDGVSGLFERFFEASPLISPYNEDGSYIRAVNSPGMVSYINPLAIYNLTNDDYYTTRILASTYLNYEFLPGLSIKTNVSVDKGAETRKYFQSGQVTSTPGQTTGTSSSVDNGSWTVETNLEYKKTFFEDHHIEALVGYSAQKFSQNGNTLTGLGFASDDIEYLTAATSVTGNSSYTAYSMLSTIARLNYNYKGKYLLSGAFRRDGSSRFGENSQYGVFPSISAGWIVSDEPFMAKFRQIDLLKIRAGYGLTGNNSFPRNYEAQATIGNYYYNFNNTITQGSINNRLPNKDLRWERNKQFDIGLDIAVLSNRISFTYDYYHKITDDLIMSRPMPKSSGFADILDNVGKLEMWGHEFTVSSRNLTGKLTWNTSLNLSFDRNLIKTLVSPGYIRRNNTVTSDYYRQQEGHHLGEFYGFVFLGLYKDAADLANSAKYLPTATNPNGSSDVGTIKVKDINGDGVIDDVNDRTFIGDPTPTFTGGMINNFRYKNFDLNIDMTFSVGGKLLNAAKWAYQTNMDGSRVLLADVLDNYWRSPENPGSGAYPRTKTGTTALGREVNSQWIENGSYLAAKNISLGYTVPLKKNVMFKNIRVYASVQQAFVITGYSGMNPEVNVGGADPTSGWGVDENAYPIPRTFSLGITTTLK
ncbi:TonB-dependent receptor [Pedobacter sp. BS3]|uniref:SusC/RagA family TonB-linked outer membrane protein n=1 Tax=Pedobacter sp. BS3 TaxID=2567937 RepID=UPI0011EC4BAC|nr:TonB-dependent receptor [Pedobacter sp. BS3]TZF82801.1 TonB-dependent receptor [Pedobacter sp. BS3]